MSDSVSVEVRYFLDRGTRFVTGLSSKLSKLSKKETQCKKNTMTKGKIFSVLNKTHPVVVGNLVMNICVYDTSST